MPTTKKRTQGKAPCEICGTRIYSSKAQLYLLKSGNTHLRTYFPKLPVQFHYSQASQHILLHDLKPNSTIFYFATRSRDISLPQQPFKDAYGTLTNSGVVKTNSSGNAEIFIDCPQIYIAEDGQVYSRHFHLVYWDSKKHEWSSQIYTHQVFCNIGADYVKKSMELPKPPLIIDALPPKYYKERHIAGAINMPATKNWTLAEVMKVLPKGVNSTTPMILYCYSSQCNAAEKLYKKLTKLGFYNTVHYLEGISSWNGRISSK